VDGRDNSDTRRRTYHLTTALLLVIGWLIAEAITDLGTVFPFLGAVSGVGLNLLFPPLCYLSLEPHAVGWKRWLCRACIAVGAASMVIICYDLFLTPA
jgi:hypothetical protein